MIISCLGILAFLFPLAIYCLIIAKLNRRRDPVMIPGTWDFAGLLFGISGMALFGGPSLLTSLSYGTTDLWLQVRFRSTTGNSDQWWYLWLFLWAAYLGGALGVATLLLWRRRCVTVIYNVDADVFDELLAGVLDRREMKWTRARNRFFIGFQQPASRKPSLSVAGQTVSLPSSNFEAKEDSTKPAPRLENQDEMPPPTQKIMLEVDHFKAMHHVSLRWLQCPGKERQQIEANLSQSLASVWTRDNPTGVWLFVIGIFLFAVVATSFFVILYVMVQHILRTLIY